MKRIYTTIVLSLLLKVAFSQTTYYVNDNSTAGDIFTTAVGNDLNAGIAPAPFATINFALGQAQPGDTIIVDAGSYTEQVNITKAITIRGAGKDVTIINSPAAPLSQLPDAWGVAIIQADANLGDVNIESLTVDGTNSNSNFYYGIFIQESGRISNCEIRNTGHGFLFQDMSGTARTVVVNNNYIHQIQLIGGFFLGSGLHVTATGNVIDLNGALYGMALLAGDRSPSSIVSSFTATNNSIIDHNGFGIFVNSTQPSIVRNNSITAIAGPSIEVLTTAAVDATCNWFGTADANEIIPRVKYYMGTANFSPWLSDGTDNDVAIGFQPLPDVCNVRQNKFYVNDNNLTGDVFTAAVGDDANSGIPSAPLATISAAYNKAQPGDTIFMDAGTYAPGDGTIGKSLTILGSNYLISPNNIADPLIANSSRNAETIISNTTWTIGASNINIEGLTFDPLSKTQIQQTNSSLDFSNIKISRNRFLISTGVNVINLTGKNITPLISNSYFITDNRFDKTGGGSGGTSIALNFINISNITGNVFTIANSSLKRFQNSILIGQTGKVDNLNITGNVFDRPAAAINTSKVVTALIHDNKCYDANQAFVLANSITEPTTLTVTNNFFTNTQFLGAIHYRLLANSNGSASRLICENNTVNFDATGQVNIPIFMISSAESNLTIPGEFESVIRNNQLNYTGNFALTAVTDIMGIRFMGRHTNILMENNEINFGGINLSPSLSTNLTGARIYTKVSGTGPGDLPANAVINVLNNKINGFNRSVTFYNLQANQFGGLLPGITVNINNNSFTNDGISINNGTTGQTLNANCNWYGVTSAQAVLNKITAATVNHSPWLTNGTDNDPAAGFQPVPGSCNGYPTFITLDSYTNVTCNGANNGTINITATLGKAPFTYTWTKDGDAGFVSNNEDPISLTPGTYHLSLVDGNGSTIYFTDPDADSPGTIDVTITEPDILTATASGTNVSCFNGANGTASVNVTGGTEPYSYEWSNNETTATTSDLAAGTYSVIVTDANGCTATGSYIVTQPSALTATTQIVNNLCYNGTIGSITVTAAGGTAGYEYSLNGTDYQVSNVFSNLAANNYTVYIKDNNGCVVTVAALVTQPTAIIITISNVINTCSGSATGAITISATGGTGAFSYSWTGPNGFTKNSKNLTSLIAGTYYLTVTDANGCTATSQAQVGTFPAITLGGAITHVQCFGTTAGAINITVGGGSGAFSFSWSGPNGYKATSEDVSNIKAGTYSVTIKDAAGCSISQSFIVTQPDALTITIAKTDINSCNGTGSITANVTGGTMAYQYKLNNGAFQSGNVFNNLPVGSYAVTVRDANGCQATVTSIGITDTGEDPYESNNKIGDADSILINQVVFARIAPTANDKDWYQFTTAATAGSYILSVSHGTISYTFNLYDNKGKLIALSSSTATTKTYNSLSINTAYYIQVTGALSYNCYQLIVANSAPLITNAVKTSEQNVPTIKSIDKIAASVYPNPHRGSFNIKIESPEDGVAQIQLYNVAGQKINEKRMAVYKNGTAIVNFTGKSQAVLFYRVRIGEQVVSGRVIGPQ
ncbi:MAG: T9SS type A sorting domain-containing protein [Bacteroidota bacterium]